MTSAPGHILKTLALLALAVIIRLPAAAQSESGIPADYPAACRMLDSLPLDRVEGIWHHYGDDLTLLVIRDSRSSTGFYGVYVLESPDCRLNPGDRIGDMTPSAEPDVMRLRIMTSWSKGTLSHPADFLARLSSAGDVIRIEGKGLKVRLSPSVVIPRLLDVLRLGIRLKIDDPLDKLPDGWRKLYPTYPQGGTSPSGYPIYL